jgi:hypothetical protein
MVSAAVPEALRSPVGLAMVRLMQLHVFAEDLNATADSKARETKTEALTELIKATRLIPEQLPSPGPLTVLASLEPNDLLRSTVHCAADVRQDISVVAMQAAFVELFRLTGAVRPPVTGHGVSADGLQVLRLIGDTPDSCGSCLWPHRSSPPATGAEPEGRAAVDLVL